MIILPCLEFIFVETYVMQIFLLMFGFGLFFCLIKEVLK